MVKNVSPTLVSPQQLTNTLGHPLSEAEYSSCLKQIKFIEPKVGQFWQAAEAEAGIYIVIAGKVRLLNSEGDLIATLEAGASFGECRFFPEAAFEPYSARASVKVKLAYLSPELLFPLIAKHPQIREHFERQAQERNLLLNPDQNSALIPVAKESETATTAPTVPTVTAAKPTQRKIGHANFPNPMQQVGHLLQRVIRRYPFFAQQSASDCGAAQGYFILKSSKMRSRPY